MLNFKTMLMYPGIIASAGWTLMNIFRIIGYVSQLKNERPECTSSNPNKEIVFFITLLILFTSKERIESKS
jgi:hypothetical protein